MRFATSSSVLLILTAIGVALAQGAAPPLSGELAAIYPSRVASCLQEIGSTASISQWISSLNSDGKWPDSEIDYTTGCDARRANWPASVHWERIATMSGAWTGGAAGGTWTNNTQLRTAISSAMDYWYTRDFTTDVACIDQGGTSACPCSNPRNTLWNTNWFSNVILVPRLVARTCILLRPSLTARELQICSEMTVRTYEKLGSGAGYMAGANILDVGRIGVDAGLILNDMTMVSASYGHIHDELVIHDWIKADGIRSDGSFGQHAGIIYNGNYGKDYANVALELEIAASGTSLAASAASRQALETLFKGSRWMVVSNSATGVLHWDYSVLNRFISFPTLDDAATKNLNLNLTTIRRLGELWSSNELIDFGTSLSHGHFPNANAGNKRGNRMFFANDYMVHRGNGFVTTLKMFSSRTLNSECVNTQNPKGFHLSDGTMYTYVKGSEYEDIAASWDWDLIPGITTDYQATPLDCGSTKFTGKEDFVGGVSDGSSGIAVMRYTNPSTGKLRWQKTWFFLDSGAIHVMVNVLSSTSGAPVYSVLDQKRLSGKTYINGAIDSGAGEYNNLQTIWHNEVLWNFPGSTSLFLRKGQRTGAWSDIGTSTQPPSTVNMWAAWLQHKTLTAPVEYTVFPNVKAEAIQAVRAATPVKTIVNTKDYSAIWDKAGHRAFLVFWNNNGGSIVVPTANSGFAPLTISTSVATTLIVSFKDGQVVVSDPSQTLQSTSINFAFGPGSLPKFWTSSSRTKSLSVAFPQGGMIGSSVRGSL